MAVKPSRAWIPLPLQGRGGGPCPLSTCGHSNDHPLGLDGEMGAGGQAEKGGFPTLFAHPWGICPSALRQATSSKDNGLGLPQLFFDAHHEFDIYGRPCSGSFCKSPTPRLRLPAPVGFASQGRRAFDKGWKVRGGSGSGERPDLRWHSPVKGGSLLVTPPIVPPFLRGHRQSIFAIRPQARSQRQPYGPSPSKPHLIGPNCPSWGFFLPWRPVPP